VSELDWGPRRPAAVSWAGVLLFLLGAFQLVVIVVALVLDARALLTGPAFAFAVAFNVLFALLQIAAAVGVIRLGSPWRTFAMALAVVGALMQALNVIGADGDPVLIGVNAGFTLAYVLIFVFLRRSGPAFD